VFVNEEHNQIPTCCGTTQSGIDVLASAMTFFDKATVRLLSEKLENLGLLDSVFAFELLDDLFGPYQSRNVHADPVCQNEVYLNV